MGIERSHIKCAIKSWNYLKRQKLNVLTRAPTQISYTSFLQLTPIDAAGNLLGLHFYSWMKLLSRWSLSSASSLGGWEGRRHTRGILWLIQMERGRGCCKSVLDGEWKGRMHSQRCDKELELEKKTLPEAQRTQGIGSLTWVISPS